MSSYIEYQISINETNRMLRLAKVFSLISLFAAVFLDTGCLVQAFSKSKSGDGARYHYQTTTPKPFVFNLKQSCDNWAVFAWDSSVDGFPKDFGPPQFPSCEITYMIKDSQMAEMVMVFLHPDIKRIRLSNLNGSTHYIAFMTCNETLTSNTVRFVTGYPCSQADVTEMEIRLKAKQHVVVQINNTEVVRNPVVVTTADSGYSVTDMVLGLFFALCGFTIACCFGYYYWKKRRHRQRILRIFGQSHSDPFLALHTPSDQPTSNF